MTHCNEHRYAVDRGLADAAALPDIAILHRMAEEKAGDPASMQMEALSPAQVRDVLYELRVHKIALEMQNEELQRTRGALAASQARCFALYDQAPVGYMTLDEQGRILEVNRAAANLLGVVGDEAAGQALAAFILPVDLDIYGQHRKALCETGGPQVCELRLLHRDGTQFWTRLQATAGREEDGTTVYRCTLNDITARKDSEQALRESEAMYRSIFENAVDGFFQSTPEGRFISVNPAFADMLGYASPAELVSAISDIARQYYADPEDRHQYQQLLERSGNVHDFEFRAVRKDGSQIWVSNSTRACYDPDGRLVRYEGTVKDITARRLAQAERERLLSAIEQAGEMFLITDAQGVIRYVNPAFERITGYTKAETVGCNPRLLKSGQQDPSFYRDLWQTISSGRTWQGRLVNRCKDGTLITEEATISPVIDAQGRIVHYVAVKRDITEHLRLADQFQQAQKMESVGRLAGGVAHDFNNMLGVILGYTELALDKVDPADSLHDDLTQIASAARRSHDITRQLLAFARKQTISPKVIDMNATVEGTLKMLRHLIGEDINLIWKPGSGLWPIKIDPSQLDQILANLCVNARDALSDVGVIVIETRTVTLDQAYCADHRGFVPGQYVKLAVSDNGCGMDKAILANIFDPFFTTKAVGQGTGLGLATVYGIVKQNEGFINVYSEPGHGTTFKIYLPRHEGATTEGQNAQAVQIPRGNGETILVVEDDASILKLATSILKNQGYAVLSANTPAEALAQAERHGGRLDLLFTDVVMPEMNGRELANQVHALCPDCRTLFMSGYTADIIAHRGVLDEGVHFIQKPFSSQGLAVAVQNVLNT
jgi:two-component system cell cycle sensor histidine kinase/response regulator CckA